MYNNSSLINQEFYSLEKHFGIVCNLHPHLKLLESQWHFDQELITKALQNVSSIFPHYSRHDASHSRQIIVNIERLLGDKIKYLSATDTWLILEAAYNHDIGMVITQKQIEDMNTPEFTEFVHSLVESSDNKLRKFAKRWIEDKAKLPQKAAAHDFFHQYIQLLAEWYRQKHPKNSAKIVRNPVEEIGLNSSRNELLPKRLFDVLADICESHGDSFEDMMSLPKAEAGMASEDCHPRYIACLLRMGDLLDIDDNRFCPVMMSMCGHNIPKLSKAHYDKHHSIKHFRLDSERIEIKCICPNPDAYEAAYDWFNWLQQEYYKQTQHWDKIVPSRDFGRLPTLMTPIVQIDEPYLIINQGRKPSFKVNEDAILKLVRGTGLYSSRFDSIREILQNAVDSTLHRIWLENKEKIENLDPTSSDLKAIYNNYRINISFEPKEEMNNKKWVLKVKDKGTGISFNDLKYMLEIGSSFKNKEKRRRLDEMPKWFRPSGAFGIGLQSAYLLSDRFLIITHSLVDNQKLKINFNGKKKSVIIEKIKSNLDFGTEFIIEIDIDRLPKTISYSFEKKTELDDILKNFDFTDLNSNLGIIETIQINDSIDNFFLNSPISSNRNISSNKGKPYFDKEKCILFYGIHFGDFEGNTFNNTYFRGQEFSDITFNYGCIRFSVDFYHTTSDKFLTYNRSKILTDVKSETRKLVRMALKEYIEINFDDFESDHKPFAALSYLTNFSNRKYLEVDVKFIEALYQLPIMINNESVLLKDLISDIKNDTIKSICILDSNRVSNMQLKIPENCIMNLSGSKIFHMIKFLITKEGLYYSEDKFYTNENVYNINIYKSDIQPLSNEFFKKILVEKFEGGIHNIGCRIVFPAWGEFRELSIKTILNWADIYNYTSFKSDYLVLPVNFKYTIGSDFFYEKSDEFINWIYANRKNDNIKIEEIRILNEQLIKFIRNILDSGDSSVK